MEPRKTYVHRYKGGYLVFSYEIWRVPIGQAEGGFRLQTAILDARSLKIRRFDGNFYTQVPSIDLDTLLETIEYPYFFCFSTETEANLAALAVEHEYYFQS